MHFSCNHQYTVLHFIIHRPVLTTMKKKHHTQSFLCELNWMGGLLNGETGWERVYTPRLWGKLRVSFNHWQCYLWHLRCRSPYFSQTTHACTVNLHMLFRLLNLPFAVQQNPRSTCSLTRSRHQICTGGAIIKLATRTGYNVSARYIVPSVSH